MTITPTTRKRKLTSFNGETKVLPQKLDHYAVLLYCFDRGAKYYITTSFVTTDKDMSCVMFNDKDQTQVVNMQRTIELANLISTCNEYWVKNEKKMSPGKMREVITRIVECKGDMSAAMADGRCYVLDAMDEYLEAHDDLSKGTKGVYGSAKVRVRDYDEKITMDAVDLAWLTDFERWMKRKRGLKMNTISITMRCLRAVFRWAHKPSVGLTDNRVFEDYSIKSETVGKLALTAQQLADFRDYPCEPWQEVYKDMSMLSFYLAGVNVGDMALMEGLTDGRFEYERQKTGAKISMPVCDEAMAIIEKYKGKKHLLNILDGVKDYHTFLSHWNKALGKIGVCRLVKDKVGRLRKREYHPIFEDMTTYTFRYSFATIASELDVSTENIGKCLGHAWATKGNVTLERYIKRQQKHVDNSMAVVMEHLRSLKGRPKEVIDAEIMERDGLS